MMIGDVPVPDVVFPQEIVRAFEAYLERTGDTPERATEVGIDEVGLPMGLADGFRLYTSIRAFQANPYNDDAARLVAQSFADCKQPEIGAEILEYMELAGRSSEMWYEHPLFLAGWILADAKLYEKALDAYHRLMKQLHIQPKAALLAHVGSTFHEMERFGEAIPCYERAIRNWQDDRIPQWMHQDLLVIQSIRDFQIPFLKDAIADARGGEPFRFVRAEDGLRNRMGDVAH